MGDVAGAFAGAFMAVAGLGVAVSATGCVHGLPACKPVEYRYFEVDYKVRAEGGITPRADTRAAQSFEKLKMGWNAPPTAAIRLPDQCANEGAARGMGSIEREKEILRTACGFWLAELERGLSKANYKVVSWNALNQLETTKHVPTYVAAHDLGADVVFIVNSLDAGPSFLGKAFTEQLKFYESDANGKRGAPEELDDKEREELKTFIQKRTNVLRDADLVTGIKAVLDMTAVDTSSGEAIWFYVKQEAKPVPARLDVKFLFASHVGGSRWWPIAPKGLEQAKKDEESAGKRSSEEESLEEKPRPANVYQAQVNELVRTVVDDMMSRFKGQGG